jgi:hypothetical protein
MSMDPAEELKALRAAVTRMQAESTKSLNRERELKSQLKAAVSVIEGAVANPAPDQALDWHAAFLLAKALGYPDHKGVSVNGLLRDAADRLSLRYWGLSPDDFRKQEVKPPPPGYSWHALANDEMQLRRNGLKAGWFVKRYGLATGTLYCCAAFHANGYPIGLGDCRDVESAMRVVVEKARELYSDEPKPSFKFFSADWSKPPLYQWRYGSGSQEGAEFLYRGSACVGWVSDLLWCIQKPVVTIDKDRTHTTTTPESWVEGSNEKAKAALLQRARELYDGEVAGK